MNTEFFKSVSIKKLVVVFISFSLLLFLATINSAKAATLSIGPDNSVVTFQNSYDVSNTVSPQKAIIDNKSMKITITADPLGSITAGWKYTSQVGPVTSVNMIMKLEYRKNFLDSWEEAGSVDFIYEGGQGLTEENEHTFYWETSRVGSYRVVFNGTITGTKGFSSIMDKASKTVSGGGSIIFRLPDAS